MQRKLRLLIVEDETAIRTGLIDVFVYHGYENRWLGLGTSPDIVDRSEDSPLGKLNDGRSAVIKYLSG